MNHSDARYRKAFLERLYPAFSRRATQVCILSAALEAIALGADDARAVALAALDEANPFGWRDRDNNGVTELPARQTPEPLDATGVYWVLIRSKVIEALEAEGLQIMSNRDRVWLRRIPAHRQG